MAASEFNTPTLHWLIERLRAGDRHAADVLIRAAVDRMETIVRREWRRSRCIQRWVEAEDILQNALIRFHRALESCLPASVKAFHRLAAEQINRELIDLARKLRGPHGLANNMDSNAGKIDEAGQPLGDREPLAVADLTEEAERWECFHQAISRLPDEQAEVFRLHYYNDLKHQEIAEMMGVTEKTIQRHWRHACSELVRYLAEWGGEAA